MTFPLIVFVLILVAVIFIKWRQNFISVDVESKEAKPKEKKEKKLMNVVEITKISAAGAIFLVLLYALVPDFLKTYHREIAVMVIAMVVGAGLLGISQGWEESSTRKILRAHFMALTIILAGVIILQEADKRGFFVSPPQAVIFSKKTPQIIKVPLLGWDKLSKVVIDLDKDVPAGSFYRFEYGGILPYPKVHFDGGPGEPITKEQGVRGGRIRFSGHTGEEIIVKIYQ